VLRGTRHTLLLFHGISPAETSGLSAVLALVRERWAERIRTHVVRRGLTAMVPSGADGPGLLDPAGHLHRRFGAHAECLYLIRPDGYVGYRSQPPDVTKLRAYLERIFT